MGKQRLAVTCIMKRAAVALLVLPALLLAGCSSPSPDDARARCVHLVTREFVVDMADDEFRELVERTTESCAAEYDADPEAFMESYSD